MKGIAVMVDNSQIRVQGKHELLVNCSSFENSWGCDKNNYDKTAATNDFFSYDHIILNS